MIPFTTYRIPEQDQNQTIAPDQWLLLAVPKPLSAAGLDLLQKISTALKADFNKEVLLVEMEPEGAFSLGNLKGHRLQLLIGFGVSPADLGLWIDMEKYGMRHLEGCTFIYTLPPDQLAEHAGAKKDLWRHMQLFLEMKTAHAR